MLKERIEQELASLREGGQEAILITSASRPVVLYRGVPTAGQRLALPAATDVVVPIPDGHPASLIDLAGLPRNSPFLTRVRGGQNIQGIVTVEGQEWQLASYHPHNGGGGPPYDPQRHGFHTYFDHLVAWLHRID
jgi:hypothetical protein